MKIKICTMLMCASMQMYAPRVHHYNHEDMKYSDLVTEFCDQADESLNGLIIPKSIETIGIIYLEGYFVDERSYDEIEINNEEQEIWMKMHHAYMILSALAQNMSIILPECFTPMRISPERSREILPGVQYIIEKTFQDLLLDNDCNKQIVTSQPSESIIEQAHDYLAMSKDLIDLIGDFGLERSQICYQFNIKHYEYMRERRDSHMITSNALETIRSCILEGKFVDDLTGQVYIIDQDNHDVYEIYSLLHIYNKLSSDMYHIDIEERNRIIEHLPGIADHIKLRFKAYLLSLGLDMQLVIEQPNKEKIMLSRDFLIKYKSRYDFVCDMTADIARYNEEVALHLRKARSVEMMERHVKYKIDRSLKYNRLVLPQRIGFPNA